MLPCPAPALPGPCFVLTCTRLRQSCGESSLRPIRSSLEVIFMRHAGFPQSCGAAAPRPFRPCAAYAGFKRAYPRPRHTFPPHIGVLPQSITTGRAYGLRGPCKGLLLAYGSKHTDFPFPPARKPAIIAPAQRGRSGNPPMASSPAQCRERRLFTGHHRPRRRKTSPFAAASA